MKCIVFLVSGMTGLLLAGCASSEPKPVHARGWVGGEFAQVRSVSSFWKSADDKTIMALPPALQEQQGGAIAITRLEEESPLARAGLKEGDLILRAGAEPITKLKEFRRVIDAAVPGSALDLGVYRFGEEFTRAVTVGREQYKDVGTVTCGIGISSTLTFDLLPNPDFSLVVLGYDEKLNRLDLHTPEQKLIRHAEEKAGKEKQEGVMSPEGWRIWLATFSLAKNKLILSQEAVTAETPAR